MRTATVVYACLWSWALAPLCGASAAEWQATVLDNGTPSLTYRHAPVLRCQYLFFGAAWKWAGSNWNIQTTADGRRILTGRIPDLGIEAAGPVTTPQPDTLVFEYHLSAARELTGIVGGGLEFEVDYNSPALRATGPRAKPGAGAVREPVLLPDNRGWKWDAGGGNVLQVAFDRPIASVHFEQGNKGRIRAMFIGGNIEPGDQTIVMTVTLPEGTELVRSPDERYGREDMRDWHRGALPDATSPVDVSFLNADDRPAGGRGFLRAEGDRLVFQDGTEARFWGTNISAYALFEDKAAIRLHARRLAALGHNLVRIHHHDSAWVKPNVLADSRRATGGSRGSGDGHLLNQQTIDSIDFWIKCLKDEGIYTWLDLHVGRAFTQREVPDGYGDIARKQGTAQGFAYFNERMQQLMREFNTAYLSHVNPYTGLAYKDEPAIVGLLVTNENDLTFHFGNPMADKKNHPWHYNVFAKGVTEFCRATGLPQKLVWRTWEPGPGKVFLSHREHLFNAQMLRHLRSMGVSIPIATTNYWSGCSAFSLPSLAEGDIIDVHSYGEAETLSVNPRYNAHYLSIIGGAQLADRPLSISEWNVFYPAKDRFTSPMQMAALASLQGWDAPMMFVYANNPVSKRPQIQPGVTYNDPAITAVIPAAAVAFRRGDIRPAELHYVLRLTPEQLFNRRLDAASSATIRTLVERSRISLALPDTRELGWDRATSIPSEALILDDPDKDHLPPDQTFVESDTGELQRDWVRGRMTIQTERTIAASGWMEGERVELGPVSVEVDNPKATVVLTSLDGEPITRSRRILLTLIARATLGEDKKTFHSEPITGRVTLRSGVADLALVPINMRGQELPAMEMQRDGGAFVARFPVEHGTHWYLLKSD